MPTEVKHLEHIYTYHHPVGWSGGDRSICDKLNEFRPAGEYPDDEAEEMAVRHALAGILAGGEIISPQSGRRIPHDPDLPEGSVSLASAASSDRILDSGLSAADPNRILDDGCDDDTDVSGGDPDRILEG